MTYGTGTFGTVPYGGGSGTGVDAPDGGVVGWGGNVTVFVEIDLSQGVDGADAGSSPYVALWDAAIWDQDEWNEGTTWTDVTTYCRSVEIKSKFARLNGDYNAGTCTIVLSNGDGRFTPTNTSSPYRIGDSTTIGIWRPIRIRAVHEHDNGAASTEWPLFYGYIRSWDEDFPLKAHDAIVTVSAVDPFAKIAAFDGFAVTPVGSGELSSARVERILDSCGFTGDRFIDAGQVTLQATDLAGNHLSLLKLTADSEGGAVWCGPDGAVYFDNQDALLNKARSNEVQVTFADDGTGIPYTDISHSYDGDTVVNMAIWQAVSGSSQTYSSTPSRVLYGDRQSTRTDLLNDTDADVLTLATREVGIYQTPERRVESLRFNPIAVGGDAWDALSSQRIQMRALAEVKMTPPAGDVIDKFVYVQGLSHRITPDNWWVDLEFSSATAIYGLVDSRWDVGVWDSATWTW